MRWTHYGYHAGLWLKVLEGLIETAGGVLCLSQRTEQLQRELAKATQTFVPGDPDDWVAAHVSHGFDNLVGATKFFAGIFLIGHGLVKIGLVAALWKRRHWAFILAIAVLWGFALAQVIRFFSAHGFMLLVSAATDVIVAELVRREHRDLAHQRTPTKHKIVTA